MTLKTDLINGAFSQMRISGITVTPGAFELNIGLDRLESMMAELEGRNIGLNYAFEDEPDLNTPHNVERKFWYALECILALRLIPDFGKGVQDKLDPILVSAAQSGFSYLSSATAQLLPTQYPSRMPVGTKNRYYYRRRFYRPYAVAPISAATNEMYIDDINDFVEHFDAYLNEGETIDSFTIEADDGLTINSSAISDSETDIEYNITADGTNGTTDDPYLELKIVITTSDSRQLTRIINFKLNSSDI